MENSKVFSVWNHFKKVGTDKAKCSICVNKVLGCKGSSTSGLMRHLASQHGIKRDVSKAGCSSTSNNSLPVKGQTTIMISFQNAKKKSLEETIARLAAEDGLTFRQIHQSDYIRKSLE